MRRENSPHRTNAARLLSLLLCAPALLTASSFAQKSGGQESGSRFTPIDVKLKSIPKFNVKVTPRGGAELPEGGIAGSCSPVVSSLTNANFEGGQFVVQAGFGETEMAGATYTAAASDFPIKIELAEMIFATSAATVTTTTEWSILFYEGTPTTGTLVYTFSSNGIDLPHLVIPPGTNGVNVQVMVDPGDPEQIILQDNGSHMFTMAYRIDNHNNQVQSPCLVGPPTGSNAFPTTDVGGLQNPTKNWLWAINCGALGCANGWVTFSQIPSLCRPTGDWVMRCTWTPFSCTAPGACCLPNGSCMSLSSVDCGTQGGIFQGEGVACTTSTCTQGQGPCCFITTGGCLTLPAATCVAAGGIAGPDGQSCTGYVCFPTGACCMPNGACIGPVSPGDCANVGGNFKGNNTSCASTTCPQPIGASCFSNGFCLILSEAQAISAGASWQGPGTTCADANGNGMADACEGSPADFNNDGVVNAADLAVLLNVWQTTNAQADLNHDGIVGAADLAILLNAWSF